MNPRIVFVVAFLSLVACGESAELTDARNRDDIADGETLTSETASGPVTAMVEVRPAKPRLGDLMELTLRVKAAAGIAVQMPEGHEALGRFAILSYVPRKQTGTGGEQEYSHTYKLQARASGKVRVPQLRIVFTDNRKVAADTKAVELLTDEIALEVESVLDDGASADLDDPLQSMNENIGPGWISRNRYWVIGGLVAFAAMAGLAFVRRRKQRLRPTESAIARARRRLAELQARGAPGIDQLDGWYVELSAIVRQYLEAHFALRAPELTTEEFLRVAKKSDRLLDSHKVMLAEFLEHCDRVKFAGYQPGEDEVNEALAKATGFVDETTSENAPTLSEAA